MTWTQLSVILLASAAGAFVKGVTGMGYPVLAVPIIAVATGIEDAVVVVALPNLAANAYLCWEAREHRGGARDLDRLVGFGVLGAVVGTIALVRLPETPLRLALALTIAAFVVQFLRHPGFRVDPATARRWSPVAGSVAGLMQGALGVSGPVVAGWLHGYRLPRESYVFEITLMFGVTGAAQIVVLVAQGSFDADRLLGAAAASLAVMAGIPLGLALRRRLAGRGFEYAVLAVLVASAVSLVFS